MEEALNFLYLINDVVVRPNFANAVIVFIFALINEIIAVLPYTVILSGQLFFTNTLSIALWAKLLVFVALPAGVGSAIGSLALYGLVYFGGKPAVTKFQKYLRFSWDDVEEVSRRFKGGWVDEIIFLILRAVPIIPSFPLTAVAGFFRMNLVPYLVLSIVGLTVRIMLTFLIIGLGGSGLSRLVLMIYNN